MTENEKKFAAECLERFNKLSDADREKALIYARGLADAHK